MPDDPCREAQQALGRKSMALEIQYRECVAAHPGEMRVSALSRELVSARGYLARLEQIHEERRANPAVGSGPKGSGEWAAAAKADPALVRAALAAKFQEYRIAGGPATRLEDVREIPDPCMSEAPSPLRSSPITEKRALPLLGH